MAPQASILRGPQFPIEVFHEILGHLPAFRENDSSVNTLLSCLEANSRIRAAALRPFIWRPHYRARYTHCVEEKEKERKELAKGNWQLLYFERRRLDCSALAVAEDIRLNAVGRFEKARMFTTKLSFDVWDVLSLQTVLKPPSCFYGENDSDVVDDATPKRFWAKAIIGVIARHQAISIITNVAMNAIRTSLPWTSEMVVASMSSFYNVSVKEVSLMLDRLYVECVAWLQEHNLYHAPDSSSFNLETMCRSVQAALQSLGFRLLTGPRSRRVLCHFPHYFLRPGNRETVPLPLTFVFVGVMSRMGVPSQIVVHDIPDRCVRARVAHPDMTKPQYLINMEDTENFALATGPWHTCNVHLFDLMLYAIRGVTYALDFEYDLREISPATYSCDNVMSAYNFVTSSVAVLQRDMTVRWPIPHLRGCPLDLLAVSQDALARTFNPEALRTMNERIGKELIAAEKMAAVVHRRTEMEPRVFVGMAVRVKRVTGIICSWFFDMEDQLRGLYSPDSFTYPLFGVLFSTGELYYMSGMPVHPIVPTREVVRPFFEGCTIFSRYFTGVDINSAGTKGRLIFSQEVRTAFPDDDAVGAAWVNSEDDPPEEVQEEEEQEEERTTEVFPGED